MDAKPQVAPGDPWLERMQVLGRAQARYLWILLLAGVFFMALHVQVTSGEGPVEVTAPLLGLDLSAKVVWMTAPGVLSYLILIIMGSLRAYSRARDQAGLRELDHSAEPYDTAPNALDLAAYTTPDSKPWVTHILYFVYPAFLTLFVIEAIVIEIGVARQGGTLALILLFIGGGLWAIAAGWVAWMWVHRVNKLLESRH